MTDNYELEEHHDHDQDPEHTAEPEAAVEHESKTETWQDDQPPVDDLMEDHAAATEDAGEHAQEEVAEPKKRKSSALISVMVGIIGLLALGGVLYWQFMRAPSPLAETSKSPVTSVSHAEKKGPAGAIASGETEVTPKTSLVTASGNSASTFPSPSSSQAGMAMPASSSSTSPTGLVSPSVNPAVPPVSSLTHVASASSVMPEPMAAPTSSVVPAAPVSSSNPQPVSASAVTPLPGYSSPPPASSASPAPASSTSVSPAPVSAPTTLAPPVPVPPTQHAAATAATPAFENESTDARIASLSARIDDLKKSLDQATQQLTQAQGNIIAASPATAGNLRIEDRLTKIEQQLVQLEQHSGTAEEPVLPVTENITTPAKPAAHKTSARHRTKTRKARKKVSPKTAKHPAQTTQSAQPADTAGWVLRAATPTEAWVAKDSTSPELHHVQIGDDLSGIGRIKTIRQDGNNWVIEGEHGTVR